MEQKWRLVKRLQYLLTNSFYVKALAVKWVVTNKGKNAPGIDGELWKSNKDKACAVKKTLHTNLPCHATAEGIYRKVRERREKIIGNTNYGDRAMQALQLLALETVAETTPDRVLFVLEDIEV